ncbi:MAG TPA: BamA/TamA family outer membrane protein, partial [Myxococcota bacterium]|nr:BamA/TamA family outer membrane protein [Myxococcota bacterium]
VKAGGQEDFFDVPVANMNLNGLTSSITLTAAFDNRDDRMFPTKGNVTSLSMEWAGSEIGSSFDYLRFRASTKQYFPLFLGAVGKIALRYGYIFNPKGGPVPIFQRFQCGGIFTIRGYEQASLGPSIPVGASRDPASSLSYFTIGGNKELIVNFEVEFPILKAMGIKGVVFFDAGNAFDDTEWPNPLNFQLAAGLGIRWWSPIGPLRFEWGFPINPREGDPPVVFEFNIGAF